MAEDVVITVNLKDLAKAKLEGLKKQLGDLGDKVGPKLKSGFASATKVLGELGARGMVALKGVAAAAGIAAGAATVLAVAGAKAVQSFRESDKAANRLADTMARMSGSVEGAEKNLAAATAQVAEFEQKTVFSTSQINEGLALYLEQTDQVAASTEDMSTILGLAAKKNLEVADAAEVLAQIRKGEIGALIDHTRLTADQEDALNLITNAQERGKKAAELLRLEYQGFAENVDPSIMATAQFSKAQTELTTTIGEALDKSGAIPAVLGPVTEAFRKASKYVSENKKEIRDLILRGVDFALEGLGGFLEMVGKVSPVLTVMGTIILSVGSGVRLLTGAFKLLGAAITTGFLTVLARTAVKLGEFMSNVVELADMLGISVPKGMRNAAKSMTDFASGINDMADNAAEVTKSVAAEMVSEVETVKQLATDAAKVQSVIDSMVAQGLNVVSKARQNIQEEQGKELVAEQKINEEAAERGKKAEELKKSLGSANLSIAERNKLALLELAIIQERDDLVRAQKQLELDLYRIATTRGLTAKERATQEAAARRTLQDAVDAQQDGLALARYDLALVGEKNEARRAELELAQQLLAIDQSSASLDEKRMQRSIVMATAQEAARDRALEQMKAQNEVTREFGASLTGLSQATDQVNKLGLAFGNLATLTAGLRDIQGEYNRGIISGAQASQAALSTLAGAATTFADQLGASAAAQAGILAIFEAAASAASFAVGDIYGGVQHAIASALYGTVAATSAGGSSGGGASAGGGAASAPVASANIQAQQEAGADLLAEKLGAVIGGGGGGVTIVYDARYSTNLGDDSQRAGELFDVIEQAGRRKGFDLGATKRRRSM